MQRRSDINLNDQRLSDPAFEGARLRPGAELLRAAQVVSGLRAGGQFRLPADSEWRAVGARCDCGGPVEFNMAGLEAPVCERCMNGAVTALEMLDNNTDRKVAA